ncbi:beta-phosphoglucomutase-like phosphatase (HAD superfamily) [Streptomonospora nanhaiensis]|uniref:Beta-phosphoglucomutase-like phosphatase (HAD superfamily) n=1 Tax=Streptomonospora nanhaiensis TaxID=1323731 RepID=A0A853BKN7_9ACTN|nr:HAD-IA family hydrolase [Streptomonospora nanhaiensis]NYI95096.1 beta-phosphoglucomutase-like phosphatase (HAD superfamily) [Streptomonospora nanhaiensis]
MAATRAAIALDEVGGVAFDMDGVVTDTAPVHAAAWKEALDPFLRDYARSAGERIPPFDVHGDYLRYLDGRTRAEGARAFLASRGMASAEGTDRQAPDAAAVALVCERKDAAFLDRVRRFGVAGFASTVALVGELRRAGAATALVSASRNCTAVMEAAGLADLFGVRVDGGDAARLHLPGKPDPALFVEAARRMRVPVARTAVVEDAVAGVEAGARGGFALVIGVDRTGQERELYRHGAHVVVSDLSQVTVVGRSA